VSTAKVPSPPRSFLRAARGHLSDAHIRDLTTDTLYMHYHIPKTAGTTVSQVLLKAFCDEDSWWEGWGARCTHACKNALLDTELSCLEGFRDEHEDFPQFSHKIHRLKKQYHVDKSVILTTIRPGWQRLISQWSHEEDCGYWNTTTAGKHTNESIMEFLQGQGTGHWLKPYPTRNNIQVAMLASVPDGESVQRQHLEQAKNVLSSGDWLVGFAHCFSDFVDDVNALAPGRFDENDENGHAERKTPDGLVLDEKVVEELKDSSAFDNELYDWALGYFGGCRDDSSELPSRGGVAYRDGAWIGLG